ncbi:unnamed protein product [Prunus brigantina]
MMTTLSFWQTGKTDVYLDDPKAGTGGKYKVIQNHFGVEGVSSTKYRFGNYNDLGDLPQYDVPVGPNYESDEEEDWETESDDSDDNEDYYFG